MRALPLDIGLIHFVGIGGIGMSGIAEVLHNLGYKVQGSDIAEGANTRRLAELGIKVAIGHRADNIANAQVVVVSSAVKKDNPRCWRRGRASCRWCARRDAGRADAAQMVDRGRRHARQDTTTSMVAAMLDAGGLDPTVINGGIINAYGTNARLGEGDWMVVESDESTARSCACPPPSRWSPTSIPSISDHYGHFDAARRLRALRREHLCSTASPCCASTIPRCRP
jgi:UDP-N-acetylmuramate--alanine ligase